MVGKKGWFELNALGLVYAGDMYGRLGQVHNPEVRDDTVFVLFDDSSYLALTVWQGRWHPREMLRYGWNQATDPLD